MTIRERIEAHVGQSAARALLPRAERDLLQRRLVHEIAAGVLRQVRRAAETHDTARARLEQTARELRDRRLADPVRPDERDDLAAANRQRLLHEHRRSAGVGERHRLEADDVVLPAPWLRHLVRRLGPRRGQVVDNASVLEEHDAVRMGKRQLRPLFRNDHREPVRTRVLEERLRGVAIELRRRLVQQQQLRLERERGRKAHALQLAAGQLGDRALGQMFRTDDRQRLEHARLDLARRHAEVLQPERDLGRDAREDHLVLGILKERRDRSGELGGAHDRVSRPSTVTRPAKRPP